MGGNSLIASLLITQNESFQKVISVVFGLREEIGAPVGNPFGDQTQDLFTESSCCPDSSLRGHY